MQSTIRQPIVVVLGHVDAGKCVGADTILELPDGTFISAEYTFNRYKTGKRLISNEEVYKAHGLRLLSLDNDMKVKAAKVSYVWRRVAKETIRIVTEWGIGIEVTPEHPFLSLRDGEISYVMADKLAVGDKLAIPIRNIRAKLTRLKSYILRCLSEDTLVSLHDGTWLSLSKVRATTSDEEILRHIRKLKIEGKEISFPKTKNDLKLLFFVAGALYTGNKSILEAHEAQALLAKLIFDFTEIPLLLQIADGELLESFINGLMADATKLSTERSPPWLPLLIPRLGSGVKIHEVIPNRGSFAEHVSRSGQVALIKEKYSSDMAYASVRSVERIEGPTFVYDFTIQKTNNFIANCLVAHNTSLLDKIRGTAVQVREAGGITQHIGASFFPVETLLKICGPLVNMFGRQIKIPGLLVIDTPGHEAFTNLRQRGGSAADIAILVVDSTKGLEPQSYESIEILKSRKVPFVIALNKIDLLPGWKSKPNRQLSIALKELDKVAIDFLDQAIYRVVGQLSQLGFSSEAYYRVKDFTKEISIVPVSATTGEGIPELLAILVGLTQQFMLKKLYVTKGPARGIVLEVKEEEGLGATANIILTDGILRVGSRVVLAKREGAQVLRVRALLMPKPLDEMRDPRDRFESVNSIVAAAGVKLVAPDLDGVLAGSPLLEIEEGVDENIAKSSVYGEVKSALIERDQLGIVVKADTLGTLEALTALIKKMEIPIRIADVGPVTKRDVIQAQLVKSSDRYLGVILAFNVRILEEARRDADAKGVKIFEDKVIYNLIDSYRGWKEKESESEARAIFSTITLPAKFSVLRGHIFRRSNPAIFGVEVIEGKLRKRASVMNIRGEEVGTIQQIQNEGVDIEEADSGSKVAVSMKEPVMGRQIREGEVLYTLPRSEDARLLLTKFSDRLTPGEKALLDELITIRRRVHTLYAY
ncbi:MAG: translation initiation factor IF-2 [Conexivisphaerales archaeon]